MGASADPTSKTTPHWPWPRMLAHRGGGKLAPENTVEAMKLAASMGWRAVEFDAMLSSDGVAVLHHDETLWRTCGKAARVGSTPAAKLLSLDAGAWHSKMFAGSKIPALGAALSACARLGLWANVEVKPSSGAEPETGEVCGRLAGEASRAMAPESRPLLSSFSVEALAKAAKAAPDLPRAILYGRGEMAKRPWAREAAEMGSRSVNMHWGDASAEICREAHALGLAVFCYTVDDPEAARRLLALGVDAFCCDALPTMQASFPELL